MPHSYLDEAVSSVVYIMNSPPIVAAIKDVI